MPALRDRLNPPPKAVVQQGFQTSDWDGYKEERSRGFHNGSIGIGGCGDSQPSQIALRSGGLSSHLMLLAEGLQLGRVRISAVPDELSQFLRSPSFWNSFRRSRQRPC